MTQETRTATNLRLHRYNEIYAILAALLLLGNMVFGNRDAVLLSGAAALVLIAIALGTNLWRGRVTRRLAAND